MAPSGIPVDLYEAVRAAEKREKAARQLQSDMLVDMAVEAGYLRQLLRRVLMVLAQVPADNLFWRPTDEQIALFKEAARASGLDKMEERTP